MKKLIFILISLFLIFNCGKKVEKDISKNNFTKEYYKGGQIKGEGNYIDDLKAGKWIYYYKTGEIRTIVNFENGKGVGKMIAYYENGNIRIEGQFLDGEEDGKFIWFHNNNQIRKEGYFTKGNKDGKWITYSKDGRILNEENYIDGEAQCMVELNVESCDELEELYKQKRNAVANASTEETYINAEMEWETVGYCIRNTTDCSIPE